MYLESSTMFFIMPLGVFTTTCVLLSFNKIIIKPMLTWKHIQIVKGNVSMMTITETNMKKVAAKPSRPSGCSPTQVTTHCMPSTNTLCLRKYSDVLYVQTQSGT